MKKVGNSNADYAKELAKSQPFTRKENLGKKRIVIQFQDHCIYV